MAKYKDDQFVTITNEFEQIQKCIGMYISSGGTTGAIHLFKEMFNNALDECVNENSPANTIDVVLQTETQQISVSDNGRGIPFDKMVEVCSKKHSSTKIGELHKFNKKSAGCNGVGLTVTVAFSDYFSMECNRGKKTKFIEFVQCELNEGQVQSTKVDSYGTTVSFVPSRKYLGDFNITDDDLITWFRHMSYILPSDVTINYTSMEDDYKVNFQRSFKATSLAENVRYLCSTDASLEFDPITVTYESEDLDVSFAFSYDKTTTDEITDSYCNYVITVDGGYHEIACKRALIDFLVKAAKQDDPEAKYEVIPDDVRKGLIMAINCSYASVILGGQTKSKVENKEIVADAKPKLMEYLKNYFSTNNGQLKSIIKYLRQMAKIRLEAYKIKGIKPPKSLTVFDEAGIRDYHGVSDRNFKGYKELIITEGKSAAGAILNVRNPKYQAVYTTSGVMTNCCEKTLAEMVKSRVPHDLAEILGVEIGPNANINNLRFDKIICMQDADADGYNIKSLVCVYLLVAMPQLVEEGRLYAGVPPLYTLSDSSFKKYGKFLDKSFLFDKHEYQNLFNQIIADNVRITVSSNDGGMVELKKGEIKSWLKLNRQYLSILDAVSKTTACHPDIIEWVCEVIVESGNGITYEPKIFKKVIEGKFKEMTFDIASKNLRGVYNNERYSLIVDDLFMDIAQKLIKLITDNPGLEVCYRNKTDETDKWEAATIGKCLASITGKYDIDVSQRYKGLGEVKPQLMFYSTLNPKVRKLIRLTMDDRQKAMQEMMILHGKKYSEERRNMLLSMDIDPDDIDN